MYITKENIKYFVGITVDCYRRIFHHYPLTIKEKNGEYFYVDRTETWVVFDDESIWYDFICKTTENRE